MRGLVLTLRRCTRGTADPGTIASPSQAARAAVTLRSERGTPRPPHSPGDHGSTVNPSTPPADLGRAPQLRWESAVPAIVPIATLTQLCRGVIWTTGQFRVQPQLLPRIRRSMPAQCRGWHPSRNIPIGRYPPRDEGKPIPPALRANWQCDQSAGAVRMQPLGSLSPMRRIVYLSSSSLVFARRPFAHCLWLNTHAAHRHTGAPNRPDSDSRHDFFEL